MQSTDSVKIVIKAPGSFFKDTETNFKTHMGVCRHACMCAHIHAHIVKATLNRKKTVRGVPTHNLKLYYKTTVIKTAEFWHKSGN